MSVRAFPMPKHPGGCRWCGAPVEGGRKGRNWHAGKYGEPNCLREFQLHTVRDIQFRFVEERDGRKCWDCGEAPEKWIRGGEVFSPCHGPNYVTIYVARWCEVRRATALELEHMAPLWSVAHLPDDERRPFFGPTNLRLRCPTCHGRKSKAEARDRAHMHRLADAEENGPKRSARPMQSRGFRKDGPKRKIANRPFPKKSR